MPAKLRLTKRSIDELPATSTGQVLYRDTDLVGFGIRVGTSSKVFFVEGQVARKTVRVTLGKYGPVSPDTARRLAMKTLGEMAQGINPNERKRVATSEAMTVRQAFKRYFEAKPKLSRSTVDGYGRSINLYLIDWADRPLRHITREMVLLRHQQLSAERGGVTANNVMRHLRLVYNFVSISCEDMPPNPVTVLRQARTWAPEKRRQRVIPVHRLSCWHQAVIQEPPLARDFLLVALLTGMRRREVAGLQWENIDLKARTLVVPKTKNGDRLELPLSSHLARLLSERKLRVGASQWVFPTGSRSGHLQECKSFVKRVSERSGISFCAHDLRRTFITVAESLDLPTFTLKRLLNHKTSADVTGGYIVITVDRLRGPVERIADRLVELLSAEPNMSHPVAVIR